MGWRRHIRPYGGYLRCLWKPHMRCIHSRSDPHNSLLEDTWRTVWCRETDFCPSHLFYHSQSFQSNDLQRNHKETSAFRHTGTTEKERQMTLAQQTQQKQHFSGLNFIQLSPRWRSGHCTPATLLSLTLHCPTCALIGKLNCSVGDIHIFTCMHFADAFILSKSQCFKVIHFIIVHTPWPQYCLCQKMNYRKKHTGGILLKLIGRHAWSS